MVIGVDSSDYATAVVSGALPKSFERDIFMYPESKGG
jgi:hypothetical protein